MTTAALLTRPRPPRWWGFAGLVLVAALLLVGTSGCAIGDRVNHVKSKHFAIRADAPTTGDLAFVLPDYVPSDAADVTVRVRTESPDDRMISWQSASGRLPAGCATGDSADAKPFDPAAWPSGVLTATALSCGQAPIHIRVAGQYFYAW